MSAAPALQVQLRNGKFPICSFLVGLKPSLQDFPGDFLTEGIISPPLTFRENTNATYTPPHLIFQDVLRYLFRQSAGIPISGIPVFSTKYFHLVTICFKGKLLHSLFI